MCSFSSAKVPTFVRETFEITMTVHPVHILYQILSSFNFRRVTKLCLIHHYIVSFEVGPFSMLIFLLFNISEAFFCDFMILHVHFCWVIRPVSKSNKGIFSQGRGCLALAHWSRTGLDGLDGTMGFRNRFKEFKYHPFVSHRIHGAGIYANMNGVYWWYPCYHI